MTDTEDRLFCLAGTDRCLECPVHSHAAVQPRTHRFLARDMHAHICDAADNFFMHLIEHAYEHCIDAFFHVMTSTFLISSLHLVLFPFLPAAECLVMFGLTSVTPDELSTKLGALVVIGFAYRCDDGVCRGKSGLGIRSAATSCADDEDAGWVGGGLLSHCLKEGAFVCFEAWHVVKVVWKIGL